MRILVTAFEPFGGASLNASQEAVRRLPRRIAGADLVTAELPVSYARSLPALAAALEAEEPDLVLCTGQAAERDALCVERVAVNLQDTQQPDNDGHCPQDRPVVAGAPAAYLATLPVRAAVAALRAADLPAQISMSAGTFVCNHVFYGLMHFLAGRRLAAKGGFLHVPALPGHAAPGASGMPVESAARAISEVIEAVARAR